MIVNGIKINLYILDTDDTIKNRIAAKIGTLAKYLIFEGEPVFSKHAHLEVRDLLSEIKEDSKKSSNISFLTGEFPSSLNMVKDVISPWIAYSKILKQRNSPMFDLIKTFISEGIGKTHSIDFDKVWHDRERIKEGLQMDIDHNKKEAEELIVDYKKLKAASVYPNKWVATEFKTESLLIRFDLDVINLTLLELFNRIILSEAAPFCTTKNYYKILKDYIPPEHWGISSEDKITLKISEKENVSISNESDYTDVQIGTDETGIIYFSTKLSLIHNNIPEDEFIQRTFSVFKDNDDMSYTNLRKTGIIGIFFFPNKIINTYVLSDLVMNNPLFSSVISIDESSKATKKKNEGRLPWLHAHFNHPLFGHITASISQNVVNRNQPDMRKLDKNFFAHGQSFVRVKVKGRDIESVQKFIDLFASMMSLYDDLQPQIIDIYREYIPNFGTIELFDVGEEKSGLNIEVPEVFVKNYSRQCQKKQMPSIVDEKKALELEEEGYSVIKFPRDKDDSKEITYPSDGVNSKYYVCNTHPTYKYIGLQNNGMDNADSYPFVPCCLKTDQREQPGSKYRQYYNDEKPPSGDKKQQDLIITDKILGLNKYGKLPESLENIFNSIDGEIPYRYIRSGVDRDENSFISCILVASDEKFISMSESDRKKEIERIKKELGMVSPLAKQSLYDIDEDDIKRKIESQAYFNPKVFLQMLESYFKVNIFLFDRDGLITPRHGQGYFRYEQPGDTIFVYEHTGSESDRAKYPQCELIIRWETTKSQNTQFIYPKTQKIAKKIAKIFAIVNQTYVIGEKISHTEFPLGKEVKLKSQIIDSYGKCRRIDLKFNGKNYSILTSPIPPFGVRTGSPTMHKVSKDDAENLSLYLGVRIENITDKFINGILGNTFLSINISGEIEEKKISQIGIYNKNKKLARYMVEYIYWFFSSYITEEKIGEITDEVLNNFSRDKFSINENFSYGEVAKTFSVNNGLTKDGKIVVKDLDTLKRLMYVLKLQTIRDLPGLMSYKNMTVISNYYSDITDFDSYGGQVLLSGEDSVIKWIYERRSAYVLHKGVLPEKREPYFFKNDLVGPGVYICQNIESLPKALDIGKQWNTQGYNIGHYATDISPISFDLYSYSSPSDIKAYSVGEKSKRDRISILGYKIDGSILFTVLLPL